jgi:hypothetical protein
MEFAATIIIFAGAVVWAITNAQGWGNNGHVGGIALCAIGFALLAWSAFGKKLGGR